MEAVLDNVNTAGKPVARKFNLLDLVKIIMAIVVIANHAEPLFNVDPNSVWFRLFSIIDEMSVPVFFIASSFLLFYKLREDFYSKKSTDAVAKYIFRIIRLYCIWSLIYLPITVYAYVVKQTPFGTAIVDYIRNFFFVGGTGFLIPQWYLLASVIGAFFMWLMLKMKSKDWVVLLVGIILLVLSKGLSYLVQNADTMSGVIGSIARFLASLFWMGGKIFNGIWYFAVGFVIAKYINVIGSKNLDWKVLLVAVLFAFVICYFLSPVSVKGIKLGVFFGQIVFQPLFVMLILSIDVKDRNIVFTKYKNVSRLSASFTVIVNVKRTDEIKSEEDKKLPFYPFCRHASTVMYFIHIYFVFFWMLVIGIGESGFKGWQDFLFTTGCSVLVSFIVAYFMCKYPKNKVLKVLFR